MPDWNSRAARAVLQGGCKPWRVLQAEGTRLSHDEAHTFEEKYAEGQAFYTASGQKQGARTSLGVCGSLDL